MLALQIECWEFDINPLHRDRFPLLAVAPLTGRFFALLVRLFPVLVRLFPVLVRLFPVLVRPGPAQFQLVRSQLTANSPANPTTAAKEVLDFDSFPATVPILLLVQEWDSDRVRLAPSFDTQNLSGDRLLNCLFSFHKCRSKE